MKMKSGKIDPKILLERITARIDKYTAAAGARVVDVLDNQELKEYFSEKPEALKAAIAFYAKCVFAANMAKQPVNVHVQRLFDARLHTMLKVFFAERILSLGDQQKTKALEMFGK